MAWRSEPESGGGATRDAIENVLGRLCTVRGDLSAEGAFRIDGTVEGSVESRAAVVVGESGGRSRRRARHRRRRRGDRGRRRGLLGPPRDPGQGRTRHESQTRAEDSQA